MSYKIIKEEFWTDPKIKALSIKDRYLFLYLTTNPHSHFCGLYFISESTMGEDTGFSGSDLKKSMEELVRQDLARFDSVFSIVWVVNMLRHQILGWPSISPKILKAISNHLHKLHGCPLIKEFIDYYYEIRVPYEFPRGVPAPPPPAPEKEGNGDDEDETPTTPTIKEQAQEIFEYWKTVMNHPGADYSQTRQKRIENRLKKYTAEQIRLAIDNCSKSAFHMGENDTHTIHDDIELICRNSEKLERFLNMTKPQANAAPGEAPKTLDRLTGKVLQLNRKTGEWEEVQDGS
jgi:hypothetical protein